MQATASLQLIRPDWPAPANVRGFMTTRVGGVSVPPFSSLNPASHVDDDPVAVTENRRILRALLPADPVWLNQVHGVDVLDIGTCLPTHIPVADAACAFVPNRICAVLTADCLPVLFCDQAGTVVAAAHAGWRGLVAGVLEATVAKMGVAPGSVLAWMGAAIGPEAFEVGEEVRQAFIDQNPLTAVAFRPAMPGTLDGAPRKWLADIYLLARIRLAVIGVEKVHGGGLCTFKDAARFYSYRRDGRTGRMASTVWLE